MPEVKSRPGQGGSPEMSTTTTTPPSVRRVASCPLACSPSCPWRCPISIADAIGEFLIADNLAAVA